MRLCDRAGCLNDAAFQPVVYLYSALGAEPSEMSLDLGLCYPCHTMLEVNDLITDESWIGLCGLYELNGLMPPARSRTVLGWVTLTEVV